MMNDSRLPLLVALVAALFVCVSAGSAQAQSEIGSGKNVGLGIGHGTYTSGISAKFYLDQPSAIQLFVGNFGGISYGRRYGYDCHRYNSFGCGISLSADYMYEFEDLVNESAGRLFLGAGGGGYLFTYHGRAAAGFGVNGVFELGWHFADVPIEFVLDVRPILAFNPGAFLFDGGAAARFYF